MDLSHSGNTAHPGRATEPSRHPLPRPPTASSISPACGSACEPVPAPAGLEMGPHLEDFMRLGEKTPPQLPAVEALYRKRQAQFHGGPALKTFAVCHPGRDAHRCAAQDPGLTLIL